MRRRCSQEWADVGERDRNCTSDRGMALYEKTKFDVYNKINTLNISWRSLGESNPCFRRERATSWAARRRERSCSYSRAGRPLQGSRARPGFKTGVRKARLPAYRRKQARIGRACAQKAPPVSGI